MSVNCNTKVSSLLCIWNSSCSCIICHRLFFPHWVVLAPLTEMLTTDIWVYFSDSHFYPIDLHVFLMLLPYCFHYCKLCGKFWNWEVWVFQLCSFFKITVWLIGTHCNFHTNLRISFFLFCKKGCQNFKEIALNL